MKSLFSTFKQPKWYIPAAGVLFIAVGTGILVFTNHRNDNNVSRVPVVSVQKQAAVPTEATKEVLSANTQAAPTPAPTPASLSQPKPAAKQPTTTKPAPAASKPKTPKPITPPAVEPPPYVPTRITGISVNFLSGCAGAYKYIVTFDGNTTTALTMRWEVVSPTDYDFHLGPVITGYPMSGSPYGRHVSIYDTISPGLPRYSGLAYTARIHATSPSDAYSNTVTVSDTCQ